LLKKIENEDGEEIANEKAIKMRIHAVNYSLAREKITQ
jgi:hypothetical protein